MKNVDAVQIFLKTRPWLKECLQQGVINYSSVARLIVKEFRSSGTQSLTIAGVTIALQRYRVRGRSEQLSKAINLPATLLAKAKLQVRNRYAVCIIERPRDLDTLHALQRKVRAERGDLLLIERDQAVVVIVNEEYVSLLVAQFRGRILSMQRELAQITLIFDKRIETTSGVVAYVYGLLAERGINVREEVSCWTDLMVMLDERSLPLALEALRLSPIA